MPNVNIKKEDQVYVLRGRDRGKTGRVLQVLPDEGKALVERVNLIKRHTRPNPQKNVKGGIVEREGPISLSSIMVVCKECGKRSRVKHVRLQDGRKVRTCKKCNGTLDRS
jgi:large subunit ribosomal protein L24